MANNTTVYTSRSVSLGTLLTVLFIGLKLGGVIDWSWVWVTAPTWIPLCICLLIILPSLGLALLAVTVGLIAAYISTKREQKAARARRRR